jgi:LPPG:FO 2-phospho-L-lactate transferase
MIVALAGGTGAAKLLRGLAGLIEPSRLFVIGNTGDDLSCWGLHVSPDLDSVMYALAGLLDGTRGFGRRDETFHCLGTMAGLGAPAWFRVGDRDLALHLRRTELLRQGLPLSAVTRILAERLGVETRIVPMSDDPVRTKVRTTGGWLPFQDFFVRDRAKPEVSEVAYEGAETARPAPGLLAAIETAEAVVVCCSNPVTSIGPILAVPGIVDALARAPAPAVAVSPIVGGAAVSGPAGKLLRARGLPVSPLSLLDLYRPWLDALVVDALDGGLVPEITGRGVQAVAADTMMVDAARERALARVVLDTAGVSA